MMLCTRIFFVRRATLALLAPLLFGVLLGAPGRTAPTAKKASPPPNLGVTGTKLTARIPDQKVPGRTLCDLAAASADGQSVNGSILGNMTKVWARLYQKGVPAAVLTAPRANARLVKQSAVVTATGGAVFKSLTHPGTNLTADAITWRSDQDQIVASGHVVFRDGKTGTVVTVPAAPVYMNIRLGTLSTGKGHVSSIL